MGMRLFRAKAGPVVMALGVLLAGAGLAGPAQQVVASARLPMAWSDPATGYAIGGYDPVAYFTRQRAVRPNRRLEVYWGGVSWNFENSGNQRAFRRSPQIYAPRFGGADPYMLSRHKAVLGSPALFDIFEGRLYLFHNSDNLRRWQRHRKAFIIQARQFWPKLSRELALENFETVPEQRVRPSDKPLPDDVSLLPSSGEGRERKLCEPSRWLQADMQGTGRQGTSAGASPAK